MPTTWEIEYAGTIKSLADWGLASCQISRRAGAMGQMTTDADGRAFDAADIFPIWSQLKVWKNTNGARTKWFDGIVIQIPVSASAGAEGMRKILADPWWFLNETIYQHEWQFADPITGVTTPQRTSHVLLNTKLAGGLANTNEQLQDILNWCLAEAAEAAFAVPFQLDPAGYPAINIPYDDIRDITCAEAIAKQLRAMPDAIARFDHATDPPTFKITRYAALPSTSLTIGGTPSANPISSIALTPRHDLQRDAVLCIYEQRNSINGIQRLTRSVDKYPPAHSGRGTGIFPLTIDLQGYALSYAEAAIICQTIDALSADAATRLAWWKTKIPTLKDPRISNLVITGPEDTEPATRTSSLPRELIAGQIADWMPFAVEDDEIRALAEFTWTEQNQVTKVVKFPVAVRVLATNGTTGTYSAWEVTEAGEPVPLGLAQALYDASSPVYYDGQITLTEDECSRLLDLGQALNLAGGAADWATMRAPVQTVEEDILTGQTMLTVGPPQHLGAQDLIELMKFNRYRLLTVASSIRSTADAWGGGAVTLGNQLPRENSSIGLPGYKQLTLSDPAVPNPVAGTAGQAGRIILDTTACNGREVKLREKTYCDNGVERKILVLCSDLYD